MTLPRKALQQLMEDYERLVDTNRRAVARAAREAETRATEGGAGAGGTSDVGSLGTEAGRTTE